MPGKKAREAHVEYHKDGSVRAKGHKIGGVLTGYWEWFRKDGTLLRSGTFRNGVQVGEWTTYDKTGAPYKVTVMKPLSAAPAKARAGAKRKSE